MSARPRLVFVGNGMAGTRALEELLELAPERYDVTVFGDEPHPAYNRILLSPLLAGEASEQEIIVHDRAWYEAHGVRLVSGCRVVAIDRGRRVAVADDGAETPFDRLVLATGASPIMLDIPGRELRGVVSFRSLRDVATMVEHARDGGRAVVIGGGLLGLEAAWGLLRRGMTVTVVHLLDQILERQLDRTASALLQRRLEAEGIAFRMEAETQAILGADRVTGARFSDGSTVGADLVVMAIGIRPNVALARGSSLPCERGVLVNDVMQTYDPRIYALGECVEHRGRTFGLVAPLFDQARVVANQLAEDGYFAYREQPMATRLKVTGIDTLSVGELSATPGAEEIVLSDASRGVYKKVVVREGKITGVVLFGDASDGGYFLDLMRDGVDVTPFRGELLLGRGFVEGAPAAGGEGARLLAAADETRICDCNGVCKATIVATIRAKGLTTLDAVKRHTKAGASCGACSPKVEALLEAVAGAAVERPAVAPMCGCTDLGHDEVRAAITSAGLDRIDAVMTALDWRTPDGCSRCRPALNYYLVCAFPDRPVDDPRSRVVNERVHANIQKDGTYSVVPRMFGGLTTAAELRAIADVVDKYAIPTVKVTGGQRVDLLGVKKEDLPAVWADLGRAGMVSGHAYGKALRTVKTCVGSEWCRYGVQDSTALGVALERMCWGAWAPHKVKLAVSGCPRNCAEATIKDFGVVAIDEGWELHVGGNGGIKVRATDVLCRVATAEAVMEHCGAFLQLYREEARYLERTAHWVERVGIELVRARVVEDAGGRATLHARFLASQAHAQVDPWAERAAGHDAHEFAPLARLADEPWAAE
ncbi:MAG: nitrite reductase large subunit NirB [Sandaracinaceae bacterium]|nr:nitrite reductase large subunit NirB [Sandaracinaceae bacterium]